MTNHGVFANVTFLRGKINKKQDSRVQSRGNTPCANTGDNGPPRTNLCMPHVNSDTRGLSIGGGRQVWRQVWRQAEAGQSDRRPPFTLPSSSSSSTLPSPPPPPPPIIHISASASTPSSPAACPKSSRGVSKFTLLPFFLVFLHVFLC